MLAKLLKKKTNNSTTPTASTSTLGLAVAKIFSNDKKEKETCGNSNKSVTPTVTPTPTQTTQAEKKKSNRKACSVMRAFAEQTSAAGVDGLRVAFAKIQLKGAYPPAMTINVQKLHKAKCRYYDIPCLDETRVILHPLNGASDDFIHANYVTHEAIPTKFICTQAPLENTVFDFWRMVWQENAELILMLCRCKELGKDKCAQYWPNTVGTTKAFSGISIKNEAVRNKDLDVWGTELTVSYGGKQRKVTHYQWVSWPDKFVPNQLIVPFILLSLARTSKSPTIVHCSAGIGRTGTLVSLEVFITGLMKGGSLTLPEVVWSIRSQRAKSVQTEEQFLYMHYVVLQRLQNKGVIPERLCHDFCRSYEHYYFAKTKQVQIPLPMHVKPEKKKALKKRSVDKSVGKNTTEDSKSAEKRSKVPSVAGEVVDVIRAVHKRSHNKSKTVDDEETSNLNVPKTPNCDDLERALRYTIKTVRQFQATHKIGSSARQQLEKAVKALLTIKVTSDQIKSTKSDKSGDTREDSKGVSKTLSDRESAGSRTSRMSLERAKKDAQASADPTKGVVAPSGLSTEPAKKDVDPTKPVLTVSGTAGALAATTPSNLVGRPAKLTTDQEKLHGVAVNAVKEAHKAVGTPANPLTDAAKKDAQLNAAKSPATPIPTIDMTKAVTTPPVIDHVQNGVLLGANATNPAATPNLLLVNATNKAVPIPTKACTDPAHKCGQVHPAKSPGHPITPTNAVAASKSITDLTKAATTPTNHGNCVQVNDAAHKLHAIHHPAGLDTIQAVTPPVRRTADGAEVIEVPGDGTNQVAAPCCHPSTEQPNNDQAHAVHPANAQPLAGQEAANGACISVPSCTKIAGVSVKSEESRSETDAKDQFIDVPWLLDLGQLSNPATSSLGAVTTASTLSTASTTPTMSPGSTLPTQSGLEEKTAAEEEGAGRDNEEDEESSPGYCFMQPEWARIYAPDGKKSID